MPIEAYCEMFWYRAWLTMVSSIQSSVWFLPLTLALVANQVLHENAWPCFLELCSAFRLHVPDQFINVTFASRVPSSDCQNVSVSTNRKLAVLSRLVSPVIANRWCVLKAASALRFGPFHMTKTQRSAALLNNNETYALNSNRGWLGFVVASRAKPT